MINQLVIRFLSLVIPFKGLQFVLPRSFAIYGHLVTDREHFVSRNYKYPTLDEFDSYIKLWNKLGYQFVDLKTFLIKDNQKKILLTFDDGFKSIYEDLHPYMMMKKLPYVLFILTDPLWNPGFSIKTLRNELQGDRMFLNEDEILDLKQQGAHIGFHTRSHMKIGADSDVEDIKREISIPDKYLSLFSEPKCFAYPYYAPEQYRMTDGLLEEAGFQFFFDTKGLRPSDKMHFFRLGMDVELKKSKRNWIKTHIKEQIIISLKRKIIS